MTRLKPWKDIILQALAGKRRLTNERIYSRVARIIDTPELTPNQKAKVRQQLQQVARHQATGVWSPPVKPGTVSTGKRGRPPRIGPKPKRKRKPRKKKFYPKKPPPIRPVSDYNIPSKEAIEAFLKWCEAESYSVTFTDTETDTQFHAGQRIHGYEFELGLLMPEMEAVLKMILHVCTELQSIYGNQDTAIDIKVDQLDDDGEKIGEGWFNVAYAGSPIIAAQRAPANWNNQVKEENDKYREASEGNVRAFSITIYMKPSKK